MTSQKLNLLNAELNPVCHLLALLGAHPILHVNRIRVKIIRSHGSGENQREVVASYNVGSSDIYEMEAPLTIISCIK